VRAQRRDFHRLGVALQLLTSVIHIVYTVIEVLRTATFQRIVVERDSFLAGIHRHRQIHRRV
jgi:hypothetical protein